MSILFESSEIRGTALANRFVRSATWMGLAADDGSATPELNGKMAELAKGGVGLIITGGTYIQPWGQVVPRQLGIHKDEFVPGLRKMTKAVHDSGGKIVMQTTLSGCFAPYRLTGEEPLVVSDFDGVAKPPYREMTIRDIQGMVTAFADAARRAKAAGFDGFQFLSAHGYLLSQFLSPIFNRRKDEYGGDIRNRVRIHLEICRAVRRAVGEDFPLLIKMNARDFSENGLTLEESLEAAHMLAEAGLDAVELSGGLLTNKKHPPCRQEIDSEEKEAYFSQEARIFKQEIALPLILVGGIRSFKVAERLVEEGVADYVAMSRPFVREPDLVNRWKSGDRAKARCQSDNLCFSPGVRGEGVRCANKDVEK